MKNKNIGNEIVDVDYLIKLVLKNKFFVGLCFILALGWAIFTNKFSPKVYEVSTSLIINEDNSGVANASAQLMQDIGFISISKNFANEMLVLKSTPVINQSLERLDLRLTYFKHKLFSEEEMYKSSPFIVILDQDYPQAVGCRFYLEVQNGSTFRLYAKQEDVNIYSFSAKQAIMKVPYLEFSQNVEFNHFLSTDYFRFKVILNQNFSPEELSGKKFSFRINTIHGLTKYFQSGLEISPPDMEATVAEVKLKTRTPEKAIDFLNSLTTTYIENELNAKKHISVKTIEYINSQLNIVGDSLRKAEENLQKFRSKNEVVDITVQSGQIFEEMKELENQKAVLGVNQKYYNYIGQYFNKSKELDDLIAPSAMGINDPMLNNLIEELIKLNAEKNSFIENNQEKSPYLKKINIRIENLRNMISENITYYKQTNKIALEDLNSRIYQLNREIKKLPKTERELFGIERKFNVNDALYTYLLEKRSEAEIAKASYQSDTKIIEPAGLIKSKPISPKKNMNYIIAVFLGISFPLVLLRAFYFLNGTVYETSEAKGITQFPILGKVYHSNKKVENVVENHPNSHLAESFRHIRVNLNYFLQGSKSKVIVMNSAVSGEGKSFISLNLAETLANSNFKTALVGFDLRKPRKFNVEQVEYNLGITSYLSGQATINDIISKTNNPNLNILWAGKVPPNPSELAASEASTELFLYLKENYDYVIVDAPPVGIVSEAFFIMELADLTAFIVRIKKTPRKILRSVVEEFDTKGINTCLILNDVPHKHNLKYGGGYYSDKKV